MVKKDTKKVTVKQIKSLIGKTSKQKSSIKGLGLKRINHKVVLDNTPEVQGKIKLVKHMI